MRKKNRVEGYLNIHIFHFLRFLRRVDAEKVPRSGTELRTVALRDKNINTFIWGPRCTTTVHYMSPKALRNNLVLNVVWCLFIWKAKEKNNKQKRVKCVCVSTQHSLLIQCQTSHSDGMIRGNSIQKLSKDD